MDNSNSCFYSRIWYMLWVKHWKKGSKNKTEKTVIKFRIFWNGIGSGLEHTNWQCCYPDFDERKKEFNKCPNEMIGMFRIKFETNKRFLIELIMGELMERYVKKEHNNHDWEIEFDWKDNRKRFWNIQILN